jgi:hypothetical protein
MAEIEQVQCPNCGGFKIESTKGILEKLNVNVYEKVSTGAMIFYWFWFVVTVGGFYGLILLSKDVRTVLFKGKYTITKKTIGYTYTCGLCNYKWDWMIGTSKPLVTIKPDLLVLAAKKLEEEEARRRSS